MSERSIRLNVEYSDGVAVTVNGKKPLVVGTNDDWCIVIIGAEFAIGTVVGPGTAGHERSGRMGRQAAVFVPLIGNDRVLSLRDIVALDVKVFASGKGICCTT